MINYLNYLKNRSRFLSTIDGLLTKYDDDLPSCKEEIMQTTRDYISNHKDEIAEWKDYDTDYIYLAHVFIINVCNSVLENRPCIKLNAAAYSFVRSNALDWALEHGHITQAERDEY